MKRKLSFSLVLLFLLQTTSHAALDVWQWLNPNPTGNGMDGVTFINGQFFVCSAAQVFVSPDGNQWVTYLVPGNPSLYRIAYGSGLYVAVGETTGAGVIVTSTNLQDWTSQSAGTSNALFAVAYGNGMFVAAGYGGTLLTSTNGSNWVARASGTTTALKSIAFGNGVFVASTGDIFGDPSISVSSDGVTWTRQDIVAASPSRAICSVSFIQGRFYAGGWYTYPFPPYYSQSVLNFSTDGTNWTAALNPNNVPIVRTVFNDATNVYAMEVAYPAGPYVGTLKSTDGTNFSLMTTVNFAHVNVANGYAYGNGRMVGAGGGIQTSIDGTNWTSVSGPNPLLTDVAWGKGTYVAVGDSIIASVAGGPFVTQTPPVASQLYRVLFANGLFHSVGSSGTLLRSTNGMQWVQRNSSTGNHLRSLCYGNGLYMAVGDGGTVITSPNGLTWTTRFSGTSSALNGVTCASNLFVAVGGGATVITSSDAINWTAQFADTLETFLDVTFGSNQFVAVGANGVICTSPDGTNWTTRTSGTTDQLQAVAFTGGTFLAAGGVLLVSTNGSTWTSGNSGTSFRLYGARSFNGTFLLAGQNGTILQSSLPGALQLAGNVDAGGRKFVATIRGGLGQSFRLQSSDSLAPAAWSDLIGFTNAPNPATFIDPASQPMRFYRFIAP